MNSLNPFFPDSSLFNAYPVRVMLGLVTSLALMIILVNLPLERSSQRAGWSSRSLYPPERIALSKVRPEGTSKQAPQKIGKSAPPQTTTKRPRPDQEPRSTASTTSSSTGSEQAGDSTRSSPSDVRFVEALGPDDAKPRMIGGMGTFYHNIEYPDKARKQGIEGRLKLEFTVLSNGTVRNVEVINSLHPLCDSAAVEGLRSVTFVPAKQNGKPIPARMVLPVRFQLFSISAPPKPADVNS